MLERTEFQRGMVMLARGLEFAATIAARATAKSVPLLLRGSLSALVISIAPCAMAQLGPSGPPVVGVATVANKPMTDTYEFNGRIQAINSVNIVARVTGFLEKQLFVEGSDVKKGDLIYTLEGPPFRRPSTARRPRSNRPKPSSTTPISNSGVLSSWSTRPPAPRRPWTMQRPRSAPRRPN